MPDAAPPETTPPPMPNQQANLRGAKIMAVILLAVPLVLLVGKDCGEPEGSVRVDGGPRTPFTLTPTECDSMQPFGRMGANLHGNRHNDGAIYPTVDPLEGTRLDIEVPGTCRNANGTDCTVFRVDRERCTRFEVSVEPTSTTVNDVRLVRGYVRVDCTLEDETRVVGEVVFDDC